MMNYILPIRTAWVSTVILPVVLLLAACTPIQPAPGAETMSAAGRDAVLSWEGAPLSDDTACGRLVIDSKGQVTFGPCGEASQVQSLGAHAAEWAALQTRFAAFDYATDTTTLTFNGVGEISGAAWQRALAAWAQLVYSELAAGRTSAAVATAMSWFVGKVTAQSDLCQHLIVLSYGYAYAQVAPCAGGDVETMVTGVLTGDEVAQFDQWLYGYAPLYVENNYLAGVGAQAAGAAETQQIDAWAQAVYMRLQASGDRATMPAGTSAWQRYQADSGYSIAYPLATYSLRAGQPSPNVLFPGVRVVEPNDVFTYRDRNQAVYKLSVAVTTNEQGSSLDQPAALFANSALIAYDPALLADHAIQPIALDGVPALRVDDLPVGPAGIATQIVALHGDFIYELLVEPHVLTTNQAEPYIAGVDHDANRNLIERIIATFRFTK